MRGHRTELRRAQPLTGHVSIQRELGLVTSQECCVLATRCGRTVFGLVTYQASGTSPGGKPGGYGLVELPDLRRQCLRIFQAGLGLRSPR